MHARPRQTDGQTDEHHGNSATIHSCGYSLFYEALIYLPLHNILFILFVKYVVCNSLTRYYVIHESVNWNTIVKFVFTVILLLANGDPLDNLTTIKQSIVAGNQLVDTQVTILSFGMNTGELSYMKFMSSYYSA